MSAPVLLKVRVGLELDIILDIIFQARSVQPTGSMVKFMFHYSTTPIYHNAIKTPYTTSECDSHQRYRHDEILNPPSGAKKASSPSVKYCTAMHPLKYFILHWKMMSINLSEEEALSCEMLKKLRC